MVHLGSGLGAKYSLEGTPIVKDGVMYLATGNDDVFALDAKTGALIWEHRSGIEQNINTVCCGWDNRGVAVGEGKVFLGQLDGSFVALDAKTGKQAWKTQVARWQDGYTITAAPLYHNGVLYSGISGGDRSARGFVSALDAKTGKEKWRFWTVPAPGEFGSDTWPKPDDPDPKRANAWKVGGAAIWQTPAIDPELGLLYFSTGNPGPEAGGMGRDRPGDNLFSASIVAVTLEGKYAWHFQQVHHDLWDFDCPSPVVLFDQVYEGKLRKGIAEACKTGWIYILDRTNGKPLIGIDEKPVEVDERVASAPTQPIPRGDAVMPQCPQALEPWVTKCIFGVIYDQPILMSPGGNGGPNWAPMAYSPRTGYFYVTAADRPQSRILRGLGKTVGPPIGAQVRRHAHRGRFPHQQDRLAEDARPTRSDRAPARSRPPVISCSMASRTASSRPMTPRTASCCGNGRPAPVPTRPPSPMRSTARNMSRSRSAASRSRPRQPTAT